MISYLIIFAIGILVFMAFLPKSKEPPIMIVNRLMENLKTQFGAYHYEPGLSVRVFTIPSGHYKRFGEVKDEEYMYIITHFFSYYIEDYQSNRFETLSALKEDLETRISVARHYVKREKRNDRPAHTRVRF